jgi:hypothetical protein
MEASSSAHHWARKLCSLGLDARIIAAHLVKPYRKQGSGGKNDANDAAAICEAASRPSMHFVPIKSVEQQSILCVHRLREGVKEERTACINRIRGLLAEFGLVFAQSPKALRLVLARTFHQFVDFCRWEADWRWSRAVLQSKAGSGWVEVSLRTGPPYPRLFVSVPGTALDGVQGARACAALRNKTRSG